MAACKLDTYGVTDGTTDRATTTSGGSTTLDTATTTANPSQVTVTTTVDPSTDPGTGGPLCAELDQVCNDPDLPCCSPCMSCIDGLCRADAPDDGPASCGGSPCATCKDGECALLPQGADCLTDCNQLIWKSTVVGAKTGCYSYADLAFLSTCDDDGQCGPPTAADCPNPLLMPGSEKLIVECDTVCVANIELCMPEDLASAVTKESFCVLNAKTADCADGCNNSMGPAEVAATCDAEGVCRWTISACTGGFVCDEATGQCLTQCMDDADCVDNSCMSNQCQ